MGVLGLFSNPMVLIIVMVYTVSTKATVFMVVPQLPLFPPLPFLHPSTVVPLLTVLALFAHLDNSVT